MLLLVSSTSVASRRSLVSTISALGLAVAALLLGGTTRTTRAAVAALVIATVLLRRSTVGVWLLLVSSISALVWSTVGLLSIRLVPTRRIVRTRLRSKALGCWTIVRAVTLARLAVAGLALGLICVWWRRATVRAESLTRLAVVRLSLGLI